eukprot:4737688-Amphidinium_carterae.1
MAHGDRDFEGVLEGEEISRRGFSSVFGSGATARDSASANASDELFEFSGSQHSEDFVISFGYFSPHRSAVCICRLCEGIHSLRAGGRQLYGETIVPGAQKKRRGTRVGVRRSKSVHPLWLCFSSSCVSKSKCHRFTLPVCLAHRNPLSVPEVVGYTVAARP